MSFDQSRIDRIKQDPDSKYNKYLKREIQLDVLENEDLLVPYTYDMFITYAEYEDILKSLKIEEVKTLFTKVPFVKDLYYEDVVNGIYAGGIRRVEQNFPLSVDYEIPLNNIFKTKGLYLSGIWKNDKYKADENIVGYKEEMLDALIENDGILIIPSGYKTITTGVFEKLGSGKILKSVKIPDGFEQLTSPSLFANNENLSDVYISITLKENMFGEDMFKNTDITKLYLIQNTGIKYAIKDMFSSGYLNEIVVFDTAKPYNHQYPFGPDSSRFSIYNLYIIDTKSSSEFQRAAQSRYSSYTRLVSGSYIFGEIGYNYDLYQSKVKNGIEQVVGPFYQQSPEITTDLNIHNALIEASRFEKQADEIVITSQGQENLKNNKKQIIPLYMQAYNKIKDIKNIPFIHNYIRRISSKMMGLSINDKDLINLMKENKNLKDQNTQKTQEINKVKNQNISLILDLDNKKQAITQLEKDKQGLQNQIDTLNADLDSKTKNISQLIAGKENLQKEINSLNEEIKNLKANTSVDDERLKKDIENLNLKIKNLQKEIQAGEVKMKELLNQKENVENQLKASNKKIEENSEEIEKLKKEKKTLQDKIDAYIKGDKNIDVDKNLIIQDSLNIFKTFIGVHKDDTEEDEFYIFCLSTAYERLQNIDGIKLYSDDISRHFLVSEAQKVLTQSKEETLYEKGLKLTRHYATRGGKDE